MIKHLGAKRVRALLGFGAIMIVFGTILFSYLENWTWIDSFYFTVSTITTVGFGDVTVTQPASKVIASFYMLLTVPMLLIATGAIAEAVFDSKTNDLKELVAGQKKKNSSETSKRKKIKVHV